MRYSLRYLPQYADQQCQQQDACKDSNEDDPPGDPVLVSETRFRVNHHWNLEDATKSSIRDETGGPVVEGRE